MFKMPFSGRNKKKIRFRELNIFFMVISFFCCLLILHATASTFKKYKAFSLTMNDYSDCSKAVSDFMNASNYLTDEVRLFVQSMEKNYMYSYFNEVNEVCRRESAIEIIEMTHFSDSIDLNLTMALQESDQLMERELYSMKLVCDAEDVDYDDMPVEVRDVVLVEKDSVLSPAEKIEKAQSIVFGRSYITSKNRIRGYINAANSDLVTSYLTQEKNSDSNIRSNFYMLLWCVFALVLVSILLFVSLMFFILKPLYQHVQCINNDEKMQESGSYEISYVAQAYNTLWENNVEKNMKLKHKAEHDPLTGINNREAFGQVTRMLSDVQEKIAYLIIDVDYFKHINDNFGHNMGDEVLKRIASLLSETFRSSDYVARIGGDEFAVIMTKLDNHSDGIIRKKVEYINNTLQHPEDGLPVVSLSVGIALSSRGYYTELSREADKALYKVKENGRAGYAFYMGEEE